MVCCNVHGGACLLSGYTRASGRLASHPPDHPLHLHHSRRVATSGSVLPVAKRSALNDTHGTEWPLPRKLRHGWELRQR